MKLINARFAQADRGKGWPNQDRSSFPLPTFSLPNYCPVQPARTMKSLNFTTNKCILASTFAALMLVAVATALRSVAQSTNPASSTTHTNEMSRYLVAVQETFASDTAATNLTDIERTRLMNESIKTNLAAQLWFRAAMVGQASSCGAKMAAELRVLESLRAGRTNDAIRELEESLDSDIIVLATYLRTGDETKAFKATRQPVEALQWARDYRLKFPYKSGNPATDDRVKEGLSYINEIAPPH